MSTTHNYDLLIDNINAAFAGLPSCGHEPAGCKRDPGDVADDSIDDACGFISYAAKIATAAAPGIIIDDECTAEELGDFVRFSMPAIQVTVKRSYSADLMATWAAAKWLEAVEAARAKLKVGA